MREDSAPEEDRSRYQNDLTVFSDRDPFMNGSVDTSSSLQLSQNKRVRAFQSELNPSHINIFSMYDLIDRFQYGRGASSSKFVPSDASRRRESTCDIGKDHRVKVRVIAANIIDKDNIEKNAFPGRREQLVEFALRKLAAKKAHGFFFDGKNFGVTFSLYQLQQELAKHGHSIHLKDLKVSLQILRNSAIEIESETNSHVSVGSENFLSSLYLITRKEMDERRKSKDGATTCYAVFNAYVTHLLNNANYRRTDYTSIMSLNALETFLFNRFTMNFKQASSKTTYSFLFSSLYNWGAPITVYKHLPSAFRVARRALDSLEEKGWITYETEAKREGRKIIDRKYTITATPKFIKSQKAASAINANIRKDLKLPKDREQISMSLFPSS